MSDFWGVAVIGLLKGRASEVNEQGRRNVMESRETLDTNLWANVALQRRFWELQPAERHHAVRQITVQRKPHRVPVKFLHLPNKRENVNPVKIPKFILVSPLPPRKQSYGKKKKRSHRNHLMPHRLQESGLSEDILCYSWPSAFLSCFFCLSLGILLFFTALILRCFVSPQNYVIEFSCQ